MGEGGCCVQLIDGDGVFNVAGIEHFMNSVKLAECGLSYAVVSIMGPQSSGMTMGFLNFYWLLLLLYSCCITPLFYLITSLLNSLVIFLIMSLFSVFDLNPESAEPIIGFLLLSVDVVDCLC